MKREFNITGKVFGMLLSAGLLMGITGCTDEAIVFPEDQKPVDFKFTGVPQEALDGYTLTFDMAVETMDGGSVSLGTRSTNQDLRTIEDFVDLEKLRILFFTCLDDNDYVDEYAEPVTDGYTGKPYESGKHDVFLFEAKTRWVSVLSAAEATDAAYQVTTPFFTLDSQEEDEEYDWAYIRQALMERPFKIAILVNRPEEVHYSDFDGSFSTGGTDIYNFPNMGPYWGKAESENGKALYNLAKESGFNKIPDTKWNEEIAKAGTVNPPAIINDLHHCQWDPVYTNKNTYVDNNTGFEYYDFILKNVEHKVDKEYKDVNTWIAAGQKNAMGAVSDWTLWMKEEDYINAGGEMKSGDYFVETNTTYITTTDGKNTKLNFYKLPSPAQGIPMYGVQRFNALPNWTEGSPVHLSKNIAGDNASGEWKKISLLRSLARIELIIPKSLGTVTKANFCYSNVYGRCEPLDVATPTNIIWDKTHTNECEWNNIYKYGPIINGNYDNSGGASAAVGSQKGVDMFLYRTAWFYGAWKSWWNFNGIMDNRSTYFDNVAKSRNNQQRMPYPHIFNPCIQRNGNAYLEFIRTEDDDAYYWHYVVYTGERNINDPSKFSQVTANPDSGLYTDKAEVTYFQFNINGTQYILWINPYTNSAINAYKNNVKANNQNFKDLMGQDNSGTLWNWPIMRNHAYVFRVTGVPNNTDSDGLNVLVVSPENRTAPDIIYY